MRPAGLSNALRGIGGEYELTRVVGAASAFTFLAGAVGFQAWNMAEGRPFDLTAWCIALPGGAGAILASIAGAASIKDRNIAVAKQTEARTRADAAGDGTRAIEEAADEAAEQVAGAAISEKDKIAGDRRA